nr:type II toxin-antitoxin system RelE/ParE family toxin [Duganella sp. 1411]
MPRRRLSLPSIRISAGWGGTRELVVHRHYALIYKVVGDQVYILRILHTARQWPKPRPRR